MNLEETTVLTDRLTHCWFCSINRMCCQYPDGGLLPALYLLWLNVCFNLCLNSKCA